MRYYYDDKHDRYIIEDEYGKCAVWIDESESEGLPIEDCVPITIRSWYPAWLVKLILRYALWKDDR